jgi:hypothetical protein
MAHLQTHKKKKKIGVEVGRDVAEVKRKREEQTSRKFSREKSRCHRRRIS